MLTPKVPVTSLLARFTALDERTPALFDLTIPVENPERTILPVLGPPSVRLCSLVVPRFPDPVKNVALLPEEAEIEAVGVPPATLTNLNFAEAVVTPPMRKSCVLKRSKTAPDPWSKGDPPFVTGRIPVTSDAPAARLSALLVRAPALERWAMPCPKAEKVFAPDVVNDPLTSSVAVGSAVLIPILPFCLMTNLVLPEDEAVNISPDPELSTVSAAKEVLPDTLATDRVPDSALTSSDARLPAVPIETLSVNTVGEIIPPALWNGLPAPPQLPHVGVPPPTAERRQRPDEDGAAVCLNKPDVSVKKMP